MSGLSVLGWRWEERAAAQAHHLRLCQALGLDPVLASLFSFRGLDSEEAVTAFLEPRLKHLTEPLGLLDMETAVGRLVRAVEEGEKIAVFGDYDVDGVTSAALMQRYFRAVGAPLRVYIPDRLREGYGPNGEALRALAGEGVRVVVTVDCGISAFDALQEGKAAGLDIIVTDHHQPREHLPEALAVINPNRADEDFPFKELAGVGVAFFLVMAVNRALRGRGWFAGERVEPRLKDFLDLVAVGTVADIAPLSGMNRILVAHGFEVAKGRENLGLSVLMDVAGVKRVSAGTVGFQLGPRLNAAGRLGSGQLGYELLMTEEEGRAREIALQLEESNRQRRQIEQEITKAALAQVGEDPRSGERCGLVVVGRNWHPGVIGIVASRVVEQYHRPTVVIALDDDGVGKGSARSIPGVDLLAALEVSRSYLERLGGHRAAAGLTIREAFLARFMDDFDAALRRRNPPEAFARTLMIDAQVAVERAGLALIEALYRFEPFGRHNPEPVFRLPGVRISDPRLLKGKHVKCRLADSQGRVLEAISFGVYPGPLGEVLMGAPRGVDVAGTLSVNSFQDQTSPQLMIKDVMV